MGGLISFLRDIKTVYKDLKITLKLTARIVLKVHGIIEDVEETVQELKAVVKGLSAKIYPHDGLSEVPFDALVEHVESKAVSLKTSLLAATGHVFNEDLLKNTQKKWERVMEYSKQSTEALATAVANSTLNVSQKPPRNTGFGWSLQENISLADIKVEEKASHNNSIMPVLNTKPVLKAIVEDQESTFEILPLELVDSFWKCDIGTFNIDYVDLQQIPTSPGINLLWPMRRKSRKRSKKTHFSKTSASLPSAWLLDCDQQGTQPPGKLHRNKNKQPSDKVAVEMIFLIAVFMQSLAKSNQDIFVCGKKWRQSCYSSHSCGAEIIELDE